MQPMISLESRKGPAWVIAHATKAEVSDVTSAEQWAKIADADSNSASAEQKLADKYQLTGPALLAFGSGVDRRAISGP